MADKNFGITTLAMVHIARLRFLWFSSVLKVPTSIASNIAYFYAHPSFLCVHNEHAPRHAVKFHSSAVSTISIVHYYFHFYFIYLELFALHVLSIYSLRILDLSLPGKRIKLENNFKQIGERRNPRRIEDSFVPSKRLKFHTGDFDEIMQMEKVCTSRYTDERNRCVRTLFFRQILAEALQHSSQIRCGNVAAVMLVKHL